MSPTRTSLRWAGPHCARCWSTPPRTSHTSDRSCRTPSDRNGMRQGDSGMNEPDTNEPEVGGTALRAMLEHATADEPHIGPVVQNALRSERHETGGLRHE